MAVRQRPDVRGTRRRRYGAAPQAQFRPVGRAGLDRQEHHADRPETGQLRVPGRALVDVELEFDPPHEADHCGSCTLCLDLCPTQAFTGPYELDARRCISYWTIEHRGPIPEANACTLDGWVFGCDVCQDVCPWNRKATPASQRELVARPEWTEPDLIEWLRDPKEWKTLLKGTALTRAKRAGLVRNAALVLGSRKLKEATAPLADRLDDRQEDPVVRGSSAWALGQIGTAQARAALLRHVNDPDRLVRDAVSLALEAADTV